MLSLRFRAAARLLFVARHCHARWSQRLGRPPHVVAALVLVLVFSVPAAVSVEQAVAEQGGAVELEARRTAKSKTFKNPNGTFTTQLFAAPVHYWGPGGGWREIESVFVASSSPGYAVRNKANGFGVSLKPRLGAGFLQLKVAGRAYDVSLEGAGSPTLRAGTARASYVNALAGVDLAYTLRPDGVKEEIVLRSADAPASYRFMIAPPSGTELRARKTRDGLWGFFADGSARPVFVLLPPTVAEDGERPRREHATLAIGREPNGAYSVTVAVDQDWLHAAGRAFPVTVDPTIVIEPPEQDTNWASCCLGWPYEYLSIGADSSDVWRAGIQFDVSALPPSADVSAAALKLYYDSGQCVWISGQSCGANAHQLDAHRMTAAWSATETHFNDVSFAPTATASYSLAAGAPSHWMSFQATQLVQDWVSGGQPNYGFLVKRSTEPLGAGGPAPAGSRHWDAQLVPKLEITYTGFAPKLDQPTLLRSNGADLSWSRFDEALGGTFTSYEIHRSQDPAFTPSAATLVATIGDIEQTSYSDTTAAPARTFTYRIVTNGHFSRGQTVTLPADGQAWKTIQLDSEAGKDVGIEREDGTVLCANLGASEWLDVGTDGFVTFRTLFGVDLAGVPAGAQVSSATLSLYLDFPPVDPVTVDVHRATAAWEEGSGTGGCSADGATWYDAKAGTSWQSEGGDYDSTIVTSKQFDGASANGFYTFDVKSAVQAWANGSAPNHGLLLKDRSEPTDGSSTWLTFLGSDHAWNPVNRPKLELVYTDGSHAAGPAVSVAAPGPGDTLSGSVTVNAAAADDGGVATVAFLVDGNVAATDTDAPYSFAWDTTGAANGAHTLAARATDNAGNITTSANVSVTVDNSTPPTVAITAPAPDATVSGTPSVTATASDNDGIERVEFYFDDIRFATDLAGPYAVDWNTLSEEQPAYDGSHVLTAKAYSPTGQVTTSAAVSVTVANTAGTQFDSAFASSEFPQAVTYDPALGDQLDAGIEVTLTNDSGQTWSAADVVARYRWIGRSETDGSLSYSDSADIPLPADVAPGGQATVTVLAEPPALPAGVEKSRYELRVDLQQKSTGKWFAGQGNKPLEKPVIVQKKSEIGLGLERFYQYVGAELGGGMQHLANVASGNSIVRFTPFLSPGRGLSTVVDLTYNALEKRCQCPEGHNWNLSISSLTAFGRPLDVHPNRADEIAGNANRYIDLVDGDGTTHRFTSADGLSWMAPSGVHLYLRKFSDADATRKWAITRPDRVTFFFDSDGFPTFVEDKNGNRLTFEYETVPPGEDPQGPPKRVKRVLDAGGRAYTLTYYTKAEAKKAQVRGKVKTIADHSGGSLRFDYYDDGNLLRITQVGGTNADGSFLAARAWVVTYTSPDGSGPAISDPNARKNPDPKTAPQSTRIYSVVDPVGAATQPVRETTFAYLGPGSGNDRWKLASLTNRAGEQTSLSYTASQTTVTAPLGRATIFAYDGEGKVTQITDPKQQQTLLEWSADRQVTRVTEPGGAYTTYAYNQNGYLTDQRVLVGRRGAGETDDLLAHTKLEYQNLPVDANDSANSISQLVTKTDPEGMATPAVPDDFQWLFGYDANGNLTSVTDPEGFATSYAYNPDGTLASSTDANSNITSFPAYDANGLPTQITNAENEVTKLEYSADGLLLSIQDPRHQAPPQGADPRHYEIVFDYDGFHRLGRQSAPKSTEHFQGTLIWSSVAYDPNDNVVASRQPAFTPLGPNVTTYAYDQMDRQTLVTGPDTSAGPQGERTGFAYDAAGRLSRVTLPKGFATPNADDFVVEHAYDPLDRVVSQSRLDGAGGALRTHLCYDTAGDLRWLTRPKAGLAQAPTGCPGGAPPSHTSRYAYDDAHRLLLETDPLGHARAYAYDLNDRLVELTDEQSSITTRAYNERGDLVTVVEPFNGTRTLTTKLEYDPVGNLTRLITPRAFDAAGGTAPFTDFVTQYAYDKVNRLIKVTLPKTGTETQAYVHRAYDDNGNLTIVSLPTAKTDPQTLAADEQTTVDYWDPGWPRTVDDPANPARRFDYRAEGWQSKRVPLEGDLFDGKFELQWEYHPDGTLKEVHDRVHEESSFSAFGYDANNNLVEANQGRGTVAAGSKPILVEAAYDAFDRPEHVRHKKQDETNWTFTAYEYDANSNLTVREDNGTESDAGGELTAPRRHEFTYDEADWLASQVDFGESSGSADDRRIETTFTPTGWQELRKILKRDGAGQFATLVQRTDWTWFDNGKLNTLETTSPNGLLERHTLSYLDNAVYVNGHRVQDIFQLNGSNTACAGADCTNTYTYDGRDRLTREVSNRGSQGTKTIDYGLDLAGNLTSKTDDTGTTTFSYSGLRLTQMTRPGVVVQKYFYDPDGRLKCVTLGSGTADDCNTPQGATVSPQVLADYAYDHLNRIRAAKTYRTNGSTSLLDVDTDYTFDPLDRLATEEETRDATRTTEFDYLGLSTLVGKETITGSQNNDQRSYGYDAYGNRIGLSHTKGQTTTPFSYAYDVHGSVSLLVNASGQAQYSYGYTAYGEEDDQLTANDEKIDGPGGTNDPLNPYRYTGKRTDTGAHTGAPNATGASAIDMGARMFGPDITRFIQADMLYGALSDLDLSLDPLTGNRYAFAGGNPLSFIEWDGHRLDPSTGGTGAQRPNPEEGTPFTPNVNPEAPGDGRTSRAWQNYVKQYKDPSPPQPVQGPQGCDRRPIGPEKANECRVYYTLTGDPVAQLGLVESVFEAVSEAWNYTRKNPGKVAGGIAAGVAIAACTAASAGTCAAIVLGGAIGSGSAALGAAAQGGDVAEAAGLGGLAGVGTAGFPISSVVRATFIGGGTAGGANVLAQLSASDWRLSNLNYCSFAVSTVTGALGGGKGYFLGTQSRWAGRTGEALAGSLGGVLPAAPIDVLAAASGC